MINAIVKADITNITAWPNQTNAATNHRNQLNNQFEVLRVSTNTELQKLNSVTDGSSGADQVYMTPLAITGAANTVQSVIEGLDTATVKTTTNQTIAGLKNFTTSPTVVTPTTAFQVANKTYVDGVAVALSGNQTVAGVKTFSSSPIVPTPTTDMQSSTKKYVDDSIVASGYIPYAVTTSPSGVMGYEVTIPGATLTDGQGICIKINVTLQIANVLTLNVNGLGAKEIIGYTLDTSTGIYSFTGATRMLANQIVTLRYNSYSTYWIIQ